MKRSEELYQQALFLLEEQKIEETKRLLQEITKHYPDHALAHNDLGALYFQEGNIASAKQHIETAFQIDPLDLDIQSNIQELKLALDETNKKIKQEELSIFVIGSENNKDLKYTLRSISKQFINDNDIPIINTININSDLKSLYGLQITNHKSATSMSAEVLLNLIENTDSEYCVIIKNGFSLGPQALTNAISILKDNPRIAAVASTHEKMKNEITLTTHRNTYRSFNEHNSGMVAFRKNSFTLCSSCLKENLNSIACLLKATFSALSILTFKIVESEDVIAWPLWPNSKESKSVDLKQYTTLTNSLRNLVRSVMDPHNKIKYEENIFQT